MPHAFPGFQVIETIYASSRSIVQRARRLGDDALVVVKQSSLDIVAAEALRRALHEYELLTALRGTALAPISLANTVELDDVVKCTGERGTISIRTVAEGDDTVLITIADTGTGIDDAIRDRVFDPFFTTKEVGRGTGQGLALARTAIVDRHRGSISFESQPGAGTTFFVRLPIHGHLAARVPIAS
jgi:K+-sensing histidine kinase KdpD